LLRFEKRNSKIEIRKSYLQLHRPVVSDFRLSIFDFRFSALAIDNPMLIRIYTTSSCPDCRQAKRFLEEHQLPYEEIDIDIDPGAASFVESANNGKRKVPTFDVDGCIFSCSPFSARSLKQELGL
jgi:glutaredoxin